MKTTVRPAAAAVALLSVPALGFAQAYQPEIAYTQATSNAYAIHVANADGSRPVKIYQGPAKTSLGPIDLAPGGGRVAFTQGGAIKVVPYTVTAGGVVPGAVSTVVASGVCGSPDFSPDGTKLLYRTCGSPGQPAETRTVPSTGGVPTTLLTAAGNNARWLASGNRIVTAVPLYTSPMTWDMRLVTLDPDGTVTAPVQVLFTTNWIDQFDTARNYDAILVSGTSPALPDVTHAYEYDIGCATFTDYPAVLYHAAHFSPDDGGFLYTDRSYLYRYSIDAGTITRLAGKRSTLGFVDWQPPATPALPWSSCPL